MSKARNESAPRERVIVATAARLFKEKGYRATTLEDIAAAVGMLKGSLYYYIRSKEELLYLVVRDPIREVYSELEAIVAADLPFTEKIAQAIANHMTVFHLHYPHIAVYLHDYQHLMDKLEQNVIETPKQYQRLWDTLLRQGIAAGVIRDDVDVTMAGYALLGMCNWAYRWYNPAGRFSPQEVADVFTKIALQGLTRI